MERSLAVEVGPLGVEVRPTRAFLRIGEDRGLVRVVPLSARPRPLRRPRRSRAAAVGPVRVAFVGSPVLTVGLAGFNAVARTLTAPD